MGCPRLATTDPSRPPPFSTCGASHVQVTHLISKVPCSAARLHLFPPPSQQPAPHVCMYVRMYVHVHVCVCVCVCQCWVVTARRRRCPSDDTAVTHPQALGAQTIANRIPVVDRSPLHGGNRRVQGGHGTNDGTTLRSSADAASGRGATRGSRQWTMLVHWRSVTGVLAAMAVPHDMACTQQGGGVFAMDRPSGLCDQTRISMACVGCREGRQGGGL